MPRNDKYAISRLRKNIFYEREISLQGSPDIFPGFEFDVLLMVLDATLSDMFLPFSPLHLVPHQFTTLLRDLLCSGVPVQTGGSGINYSNLRCNLLPRHALRVRDVNFW